MIGACPSVPTGPGFLTGLLGQVDCVSKVIAEQSFAFLAAPGGIGLIIMGIAVTLLVAWFGFRLMFGPTPSFGDATGNIIRIGVALAIATSWPAVSKVIASPILNGPAEVTAWASGSSPLEARLGQADDSIGALTSWGTGTKDLRSQRTASGDYAANEAATVSVADSLAFGGARVSFLVTAIAGIGIIGLLSAILIGFAPLFSAFLLFDRTRGIFAGWLRTLIGLLVAGAALRLILSLETIILGPWLAEAVRQRQSFLATPTAATELLAMTLAFGLIAAASLFIIIRTVVSLDISTVMIPDRERDSQPQPRIDQQAISSSERVSLVERDRQTMRTVEGLRRIDRFRETSRRESAVGSFLSATSAGAVIDAPSQTRRSRQARPTGAAKRRDDRT